MCYVLSVYYTSLHLMKKCFFIKSRNLVNHPFCIIETRPIPFGFDFDNSNSICSRKCSCESKLFKFSIFNSRWDSYPSEFDFHKIMWCCFSFLEVSSSFIRNDKAQVQRLGLNVLKSTNKIIAFTTDQSQAWNLKCSISLRWCIKGKHLD